MFCSHCQIIIKLPKLTFELTGWNQYEVFRTPCEAWRTLIGWIHVLKPATHSSYRSWIYVGTCWRKRKRHKIVRSKITILERWRRGNCRSNYLLHRIPGTKTSHRSLYCPFFRNHFYLSLWYTVLLPRPSLTKSLRREMFSAPPKLRVRDEKVELRSKSMLCLRGMYTTYIFIITCEKYKYGRLKPESETRLQFSTSHRIAWQSIHSTLLTSAETRGRHRFWADGRAEVHRF
jgi:hypothetical protein